MTQSRDDIIARIRKLSKMTTAAGCTEAEAAQALALIAKITEEHSITLTEVTLRTEANGMLRDFIPEFKLVQKPWFSAVCAIAALFDTKAWLERGSVPMGKLLMYQYEVTFFGYPMDVAASLAMAQVVQYATASCSHMYGASLKGKGKAEAQASYEIGMTTRLRERIFDMKRQRDERNAARPSGTDLVVLKGQLVRDAYDKLGLSLGQMSAMVAKNSAAFAQGRVDGDAVDFSAKHNRARAGMRQVANAKLITQG